MATLNPTRPTYVELARSDAIIERQLAPEKCARLATQVEGLSVVQVKLTFTQDELKRPMVAGDVRVDCKLACQWCLEPVDYSLTSAFQGVLANSEQQASQWWSQDSRLNIIVTTGEELDEVELVEDELLLRLPHQICTDVKCERRPVAQFGGLNGQGSAPVFEAGALSGDQAQEQKQARAAPHGDGPFAILRVLQNKPEENSTER